MAGRFPETMAAIDDNGRTALHYAATINDNGHFFNLLSHLGSNPKAEDNVGHSKFDPNTHVEFLYVVITQRGVEWKEKLDIDFPLHYKFIDRLENLAVFIT